MDDSLSGVSLNSTMRLFSPAKVNLLLAVTGKREDGFHELISLVSPLSFGDTVSISRSNVSALIDFRCSNSEVPVGDENLVVRAARTFLERVGQEVGLTIHLEKKIPLEAGLGGGSSNAATTLLILNELLEQDLPMAELSAMAAELGSDCPLFLHRRPVIMRGRGEKIELLSTELSASLEGRKLAVFKPKLGIPTAWAYGRLAEGSDSYADGDSVEQNLARWKSGDLSLTDLLMNSLEEPVFEKFVALPALIDQVREELGLRCLMSGSGSSCFALLDNDDGVADLREMAFEAWGRDVLFEVCQLGIKAE